MKPTGVQSSDGAVEEIVLGVDTHLDAHLAVALDGLGRHLGESKYRRPSGATGNYSVGRRVSEL